MRKCSLPGMLCATAAAVLLAFPVAAVRADSPTNTAPSVYRTIDVAGDPSQFADIQDAATNTPDSNAVVDPVSLKIVNDSAKLYLQINYATSANPQMGSGLFLGIDSDNNTSTGYHVFGSANIGSNAAFENDFPFTQAGDTTPAGVSENQNFNSGGMLTSASSTANGTGLYLVSPYNTSTTYQMIALPLDLTESDTSTSGFSGLVFPNGTPFSIEAYTDAASGDSVVLGTATYTLATADAPEPTSFALLAVSSFGFFIRRRRDAVMSA